MTAGQPQVVVGQGHFAQHLVGRQAIATAVQQPEQLVAGDFRFSPLDHLLDFFQIVGPVAAQRGWTSSQTFSAGVLRRGSRRNCSASGRRKKGVAARRVCVCLPRLTDCHAPEYLITAAATASGTVRRLELKVPTAPPPRLSD